jgi:hypothetical protein
MNVLFGLFCNKLFFITFFSGSKASAGKLVHMKVVDDKLRIIDDVPSSAVEMAVKEKVRISCSSSCLIYYFFINKNSSNENLKLAAVRQSKYA